MHRRTRSLIVRLIVPAALVVLIGVLAALQFRWLTQVADADRERRQTTLRQRAEAFADEFDREIARLYLALQAEAPTVLGNDLQTFSRHLDAWHERARFPQLLRALYRVDSANNTITLREFKPDAHEFVPAEWSTPALKSIRERLATPPGVPPLGEIPRSLVFGHPPVLADAPALLIALPAIQRIETAEPRALVAVGMSPTVLVALLDLDAIKTTILPTLMAQYFPERADDTYRIAVVDQQRPASVIASRNLADGASLDAAHADATTPIFALRLDLFAQVVTTAARPSIAAGGRGGTTIATTTGSAVVGAIAAGRSQTFQVMIDQRGPKTDLLKNARSLSGPAWQVALQHSAGSLDAAVTRVRRRNLWVSFGILAVLAAGVGLVVINAQRAQRLASQQMDFVATVSHELRTPVAVIRSAAQNLSAGVVHDATQAKRYGDLIENEGQRLTRTVDQVLEYAGLTSERRLAAPATTDVGAVVRDVISSHDAKLRDAGIDVNVDITRELPPVAIDADALHRALDNLIANAVKYGADGRWIGLGAKQAVIQRRAEVQVSVTDHGRGIDASDLPHIFEPFYRGRHAIDRQIDGSGLGLSLVKRIAEMRGGRVTVESTRGQGTTFTLHLPVVHDVATNVALGDNPEPAGPRAH